MTEKKRYGFGSSSITVAMPAELLGELNAWAERIGITRNRLIVEAIREILKRYEGRAHHV